MKKEQQVEEKLRKLELELGLDFGSKQADFDEIFASLQLRKKEMDRLERKLEETFKDIPGLRFHEKYKHFAVSAIKREKEKILSRKDSKFVLQVLECVVHFQETDVMPLILLCRYVTDEMFDALLEPSDGLDVGNILKENQNEEGQLNLNWILNPLNDAMQYFIKEGNVYWTNKILQINGSLGKKNLKCEAPIDSISYSTMKKLLDVQISRDTERDSEMMLTNIFGDPKNRHDIDNIKTIAKSSIVGLNKNEKLYNLALHPLCQAIVLLQLGWKEYLPYHDWHEYFFILFTSLWLYHEVPPVLAVISAFFSLFMVISQHPSILPLRFMFAQIVYRYITVSIFSFALIGGFALSFYMIDYDERYTGGLFKTPFLAILQVISMMTGDYSLQDFENDKNSTNIQLLFICFVILIACCLFNMMNGLAFNITSELKKSAEVSRTFAQCQMIANFQSFLEMAGVMEKKFGLDSLPYDVAKIKVNLKSGALKIAEEYDEGLQYHVRAASKGQFFFDEVDLRTPKLIKWVWIDRIHLMDVQILRDLHTIRAGETKTKQSIDSSDEVNESESDNS
ncbi:uncharacterized protein LOC135946371 [Cloeon dipterum]|uniref:uncharacterized protein LOC135946371 n=1 Tax=Cloeon dipterum TaxID=197152 RepID=UPI0032208AF4